MTRTLLVLTMVVTAAACGDETDPAPPGAPISDPPVGSPSAPIETRPLLLVAVAGSDAGVDTITVAANTPMKEGSLLEDDVTLEDTNTTATFALVGIDYDFKKANVDLLYPAGTLVGGDVFQLTISAAHLTDYFGTHLPQDFVKTFTVK